ncbi:MAG: pyridoxal-phosphate dependent enzyme, partial [Chlorobi bacterium]|nr:pyridoxal-phosphate dependent enzyme [Chlorobiota bacterium]
MEQIPSAENIISAANRIQSYIHRTPVLTCGTFNRMFNASLFFKCENFQKVGAFKSRGAVNAVFSLDEKTVSNGVATHSSGNHAQALARAAALRNIPAFIVMPRNAPQVKTEAVRHYGGNITFCEPTLQAREETLQRVIGETGAVEIHPYDNYRIIEGQASCAMEFIEDAGAPDLLLCPVGGGGLLAGTALSSAFFSKKTEV